MDWKDCLQIVEDLQQKLVVAYRNKDLKLVKKLQNKITRSYTARTLAVQKVISNKGGKNRQNNPKKRRRNR